MKELSEKLSRTVEFAEPILAKIAEAESRKPALKGGWSRKQVIGHLIDSASNNHQRFVRAALRGSLEFPGYDQDGCVRVQAVQDAPWPLLALEKLQFVSRPRHCPSAAGPTQGAMSNRRQRARLIAIHCRGLFDSSSASSGANRCHGQLRIATSRSRVAGTFRSELPSC
jgi:hypothetical protein